ncbi:hypothetical protein DB354_09995 [Opitutus sp. ER46]|nr:heavy metal-binding domain-containing protein [Opitutus sp. ER46]PTX95732.1 hypothetical protein DB354_09995 [Opitutus sp. ER46]
MQCVSTDSIDGRVVAVYCGIVAAEVVFGANFVRDLAASVVDVTGGRSATYEREFEAARQTALQTLIKKAQTLKADAILGMRFNYQVLGERNGMMLVAAYGTAVQLTKSDEEKRKDATAAEDEAALYFVTVGSMQRGPFSAAQLRELHAAGRIDGSGSARIEGCDREIPLAELLTPRRS